MLPAATSPVSALDRALMDVQEGHALWRANVLDANGNGVALTWGFGHPLAAPLTQGPVSDCASFAVLVFAQGTPSFWLHQLYPPAEGRWHEPAGRWQFGTTQIEAFRDLKAQVVIVRIDCALPGTRDRLSGIVEMGGVPRRVERGSEEAPSSSCDWSPLMGFGEGRAILQAGPNHHFHLQGRAYHERFGSSVSLSEDGAVTGGGHFPFADRDLSFRFALDEAGHGEAVGLEVDQEGRSRSFLSLRAEASGPPAAVERLTLWHGEEKWLEAKTEHLVHDRGEERHLLMRGRASMAIPPLGLIEWRNQNGNAQSQAQDFVHRVAMRPSLRTRLESGTARNRWKRGLRWWMR